MGSLYAKMKEELRKASASEERKDLNHSNNLDYSREVAESYLSEIKKEAHPQPPVSKKKVDLWTAPGSITLRKHINEVYLKSLGRK